MGAARGTRQHRRKRRQLRHSSVVVELVTAEIDHLAEEAVDGVRINPRISLLSEMEENS